MNINFTIKDCSVIDATTFSDERGSLSVIENEHPFVAKRVLRIQHIAASAERGAHIMEEGSEVLVTICSTCFFEMVARE